MAHFDIYFQLRFTTAVFQHKDYIEGLLPISQIRIPVGENQLGLVGCETPSPDPICQFGNLVDIPQLCTANEMGGLLGAAFTSFVWN